MYKPVDDKIIDQIIILLRNKIDLTDACFVFSVSIWQVIPRLKQKLKDEPRLYVRSIKPLLVMFRKHGASIRQTMDTFDVSLRTADRAGFSEERLEKRRALDRAKTKRRLDENPEMREKQRIATRKWYAKNKSKKGATL